QQRNLERSNLPPQRFELRSLSTRTEHVRAFARIVAVVIGVRYVVDAVQQKTKWKQNVDEAGPKASRAPVKFSAEGHEIEKRRGGPQTGTGNLQKKKRAGNLCAWSACCLRLFDGNVHQGGKMGTPARNQHGIETEPRRNCSCILKRTQKQEISLQPAETLK